MGDWRDNPPPPEQVDATIDLASGAATIRCVTEVVGASVLADDGRALPGQPLRGFGAVASVMERRLREEGSPLRGQVEQHDGWLELTAIWDGEALIDGDGADLAAFDPDFDEDEHARELEDEARRCAALIATDHLGLVRVEPVTAKAAVWLAAQFTDRADWDGGSALVDEQRFAELAAAARRDGRTLHRNRTTGPAQDRGQA